MNSSNYLDEAGRGPVLGSLVYCAAFWPVSENAEICKLGFDDSKALKDTDRERLFEGIRNHPSIGWVIEEIDAMTLSQEMLRTQPISLNKISYNGVVRMLEKIRDANQDNPMIVTYG
jgi:ribonuclease H2 subunit A